MSKNTDLQAGISCGGWYEVVLGGMGWYWVVSGVGIQCLYTVLLYGVGIRGWHALVCGGNNIK